MTELMRRVRDEVERRGLTKAELVAITGLDWKTVDSALSGKLRPRRTTERLMAMAVGLSVLPNIPVHSSGASDAA